MHPEIFGCVNVHMMFLLYRHFDALVNDFALGDDRIFFDNSQDMSISSWFLALNCSPRHYVRTSVRHGSSRRGCNLLSRVRVNLTVGRTYISSGVSSKWIKYKLRDKENFRPSFELYFRLNMCMTSLRCFLSFRLWLGRCAPLKSSRPISASSSSNIRFKRSISSALCWACRMCYLRNRCKRFWGRSDESQRQGRSVTRIHSSSALTFGRAC